MSATGYISEGSSSNSDQKAPIAARRTHDRIRCHGQNDAVVGAVLLVRRCVRFAYSVILSTGGTIAGKHDATRGGYVPALTGAELIAAVPNLREIAAV